MEKNIKNIKKQFKEQGVFYTPPELANTLLEYVDIEYKTAYDPTCGSGNLLSVLDSSIKKYGQELDGEQLEIAKERLDNFEGYVGNTLTDDGFKDMKFDLILGNPPFSVKWNPDGVDKKDVRFKGPKVLAPPSKADWAFMQHILYHLKDDGVAVVLEFPGIMYRGNKEGKIRQWFVDNNYIDKVVHIPGDTFVDTKISTVLIVLKKNKTTTDIVFEDREKGLNRTVPLQEIIDNKYNLSVSTYVFEEVVKEPIDIDSVNKSIADNLLKMIEAHLKTRDLEKFFGDNFYIDYFKEETLKLFEKYE